MNNSHDDGYEGFDDELAMLREMHPSIEPIALDRVKRRVRVRAGRSSVWRNFVRSRLAVVVAIATGALLSTGATALGISGLASSGDASISQYTQGPTGSSGGSGTSAPSSAVAPADQVAQIGSSSSGSLPFTGFAVIPLLLIGVVCLVAGLLGRRAAERPDEVRRT
jgi:hypothetical protein